MLFIFHSNVNKLAKESFQKSIYVDDHIDVDNDPLG